MNLFKILVNTGQRHSGTVLAPETIASFLKGTKFASETTVHINDSYAEGMREVAAERRRQSGPTLILGGDHSMSLATVPTSMMKHPGSKVLWIDAHADLNTPETSPSGNLHGMPVAALTGLFKFTGIPQCMNPQDVAYVGLRDIDASEMQAINEHGIVHFTSEHVMKHTDRVIKAIRQWCGESPVHISFDVDVADPSIAIGTGTRVENGVHMEQMGQLVKALLATNWHTLEIVEVNPKLDYRNMTSEFAAGIAAQFAAESEKVDKSDGSGHSG